MFQLNELGTAENLIYFRFTLDFVVGYEMMIANLALRVSLAIYHLISQRALVK